VVEDGQASGRQRAVPCRDGCERHVEFGTQIQAASNAAKLYDLGTHGQCSQQLRAL
jgi:hypothetical protein